MTLISTEDHHCRREHKSKDDAGSVGDSILYNYYVLRRSYYLLFVEPEKQPMVPRRRAWWRMHCYHFDYVCRQCHNFVRAFPRCQGWLSRWVVVREGKPRRLTAGVLGRVQTILSDTACVCCIFTRMSCTRRALIYTTVYHGIGIYIFLYFFVFFWAFCFCGGSFLLFFLILLLWFSETYCFFRAT